MNDFPKVKYYRICHIGATTNGSKMAQVAEKVDELKKRYPDIFGDLTSDRSVHLDGPAMIHLTNSDEAPFRARTARRPPRALQDNANKLLRQLEKLGVISRVWWPMPCRDCQDPRDGQGKELLGGDEQGH